MLSAEVPQQGFVRSQHPNLHQIEHAAPLSAISDFLAVSFSIGTTSVCEGAELILNVLIRFDIRLPNTRMVQSLC